MAVQMALDASTLVFADHIMSPGPFPFLFGDVSLNQMFLAAAKQNSGFHHYP